MRELEAFVRQVVTPRGDHGWKVQFVQHLVTGAIATAAHYGVMWAAMELALIPVLATTVGFIAGATTRFLFSYFHIFEPERDVAAAVPHFLLALGLQMVLNAALLTVLLQLTSLVWPAQVVTTALLTTFNFLMYKFWVFK